VSENAQAHRKNKRGWRLLTLATVVFFIVAGIYFVIVPVQQSKRLEQALIDQFDWANEYTPPIDGFVPAERVERFIRVREAVQTNCTIFQGILDDVIKLESIESNPDMSAGQKASEGIDSFKSMFSAAPKFLEFMDARNQALLSEAMGLGEYFYIYLAAYGPQLAAEPGSRYADQDEAYISPRTRDEFTQILSNQLAAVETADQEQSRAALSADLKGEIERLQGGAQSSPWPDGPPARTSESLAPYQERLAELYCTGIVRTELLQKNRGLNIRD